MPASRPEERLLRNYLLDTVMDGERKKKKKKANLAGFKPIFALLIVFKFQQHNEHVPFPHAALS